MPLVGGRQVGYLQAWRRNWTIPRTVTGLQVSARYEQASEIKGITDGQIKFTKHNWKLPFYSQKQFNKRKNEWIRAIDKDWRLLEPCLQGAFQEDNKQTPETNLPDSTFKLEILTMICLTPWITTLKTKSPASASKQCPKQLNLNYSNCSSTASQ